MGGMINFCIGWPLPNLRTGVSLVVVAVVLYVLQENAAAPGHNPVLVPREKRKLVRQAD